MLLALELTSNYGAGDQMDLWTKTDGSDLNSPDTNVTIVPTVYYLYSRV